MKAHAGILGNEIADRLAKEATQNSNVTYRRIPKSAIKRNTRKESIKKLQRQWEETTKGVITKEFIPSVERRLAANFTLTLRLLISYIYGAPSKARNANVVYIWTYVWQR